MLRSATLGSALGSAHRRDMQGLEKAHGEGAGARRCFAGLRTASQGFAECVQPKLLWLCEWLSDPQHSPLPPCVRVRARAYACANPLAKLGEAMREPMLALALFSTLCKIT